MPGCETSEQQGLIHVHLGLNNNNDNWKS